MSFFSFPSQVNEYAARSVATLVATTIVVAYVAHAPWLLPLLGVGFLLRVGWGPRFSPYARLATAAAKRLWEPRPVFGAPKRFAQGIGAVCMTAATALWLAGKTEAAWGVAAMVFVFATLEASFAFCMGCWVYGNLQRIGVFPPDACVNCRPV